jgi:hypothetical protein
MVYALQRFSEEGAWGVSPHFIPHRSQHAVSGTISQALKIHGPNFGTGGGPDGTPEALIAGAALVEENRVPGVWVVATAWDSEVIPDANGHLPPASVCKAWAFAMVPARHGWPGAWLRVAPGKGASRNGRQPRPGEPGYVDAEAIFEAIVRPENTATKILYHLDGGGSIEIGHSSSHSRSTDGGPHLASGGWTQVEHDGAKTENKR